MKKLLGIGCTLIIAASAATAALKSSPQPTAPADINPGHGAIEAQPEVRNEDNPCPTPTPTPGSE